MVSSTRRMICGGILSRRDIGSVLSIAGFSGGPEIAVHFHSRNIARLRGFGYAGFVICTTFFVWLIRPTRREQGRPLGSADELPSARHLAGQAGRRLEAPSKSRCWPMFPAACTATSSMNCPCNPKICLSRRAPARALPAFEPIGHFAKILVVLLPGNPQRGGPKSLRVLGRRELSIVDNGQLIERQVRHPVLPRHEQRMDVNDKSVLGLCRRWAWDRRTPPAGAGRNRRRFGRGSEHRRGLGEWPAIGSSQPGGHTWRESRRPGPPRARPTIVWRLRLQVFLTSERRLRHREKIT